jgi:hypothetical protein
MEDKNYSGEYALKITLSDKAWSSEVYRKRIESGELENLIVKSSGVNKLWRGSDGIYQNVAVIDNSFNAFSLMKKINELPYVQGINFVKDSLKYREGYISVKS